ncbi:phage regulatory protein, Rha family [Acetobacteraceae bacterium AT-5844]|nr:phage regulatory protein, Rha family [Acetobacteraceae bacterium AT-5844]
MIVTNGVTRADSRDVAAFFRKRHDDVIKAIKRLRCSAEFRLRNFAEFKNKDLTGEHTSHFMMTKDGFTFLVMGFTGADAAAFKEAYIAQFNAMEDELRSRSDVDPMKALGDPVVLRALLLGYDEKVIALEAKVASDAPKTVFYDKFINADGLYGLQSAGRALGQGPNKFVARLKQGYLFYQGGNLIAKQVYIQQGLFEMKSSLDEQGKTRFQAFITPKGLQYFAKKFGLTVIPPAEEMH